MINRVVAKNFKGREFDVAIGQKTLIYGPNGTGKSAIVQALELAINGHVSGGTYKTNAAILEIFGKNEKLTVEASIKTAGNGSTQLARQFYRADELSPTVSQVFLVDRRRADAKTFMAAMGSAGAPRVVTVDDFLSLSPSKMISYLAAFTGGQEIDDLMSKIATENEKLNGARTVLRNNETYISRILGGVAELGLPAGTLAEVQASIKLETKNLAKAKADLKEAELAEKVRIANEKKEEAKRLEDEAAKEVSPGPELPLHHPAPVDTVIFAPHPNRPGDISLAGNPMMVGKIVNLAPAQAVVYPKQEEQFGPPQEKWHPHQGLTAMGSLQKILKAIDALGAIDAAEGSVSKLRLVKMVVENEMKKWEGK